MNKYLIIFIFSIVNTFSFAQNNHENNIKKGLNAFLNGIESKQMDRSSFPNGQKLKEQISEGLYTKFGKKM